MKLASCILIQSSAPGELHRPHDLLTHNLSYSILYWYVWPLYHGVYRSLTLIILVPWYQCQTRSYPWYYHLYTPASHDTIPKNSFVFTSSIVYPTLYQPHIHALEASLMINDFSFFHNVRKIREVLLRSDRPVLSHRLPQPLCSSRTMLTTYPAAALQA